MITSMTGYAAISKEIPQGSLALELRSVNNRYLDLLFRLPDEFRPLEPDMRELLGARLARGKIDCRLTFTAYPGAIQRQRLNNELLHELRDLSHEIKSVFPNAGDLTLSDILRWPGVLDSDRVSFSELHAPCMELLQATLHELIATREREGDKLKLLLLERLHRLRQLVLDLLPRLPAMLTGFQERLLNRLQAAGLDEKDERIRQEFTLFANKIDVDEELSRLQSHLDEVERTLQKGGVAGKRLDFLMQELNREANTLASKSVDSEITQASVEIKVLIEQLREQIQNIE
ncbi:YicC/YloC family endoribonuclease [Nitrosomonas halophila]|uniref:TIGR00255 family protein n=1 Tax=Nitrosomonas halophila TaxID=44576 RepID=A0A1H3DWL1_9PROT|nr:YicC/YloC family endoribonuclease [Nitrosomonas halophila]SDX70816.1 TIGR00255 family protein [Nitrosomonas halophila]